MAAGSSAEISERVRRLVRRLMADNAIATPLQKGVRLADIGLMSMDMVNLMLAVEAEFDLMIPQADITPENFESAESIERLVQSLCATRQGHSGDGEGPSAGLAAEV